MTICKQKERKEHYCLTGFEVYLKGGCAPYKNGNLQLNHRQTCQFLFFFST